MNSNITLYAFIFSAVAGLATLIGAWAAYNSDSGKPSLWSSLVGLSSGGMLLLAFSALQPSASSLLTAELGINTGPRVAWLAFFGGFLALACFDRLLDEKENPHYCHSIEELVDPVLIAQNNSFIDKGYLYILLLFLHSVPEGIVVFLTTLCDWKMGVAAFIFVAIHNASEGISVSIPIFYTTGDRTRTFLMAGITALGELGGAFLGFVFIGNLFSNSTLGIGLAVCSGFMLHIALTTVFSVTKVHSKLNLVLYGAFIGMMGALLVLPSFQ